MINIHIDENTSILEPYYDGSESYKGHNKYSVVGRYSVTPENSLAQGWDGINIEVKPGGVTLLRRENIDVDITGYDKFRLFGIIPEWVHVRLYCNDELVLDDNGPGKTSYLDGKIKTTHTHINSLVYEFTNQGNSTAVVALHYLGMFNDRKSIATPFTSAWEGFFSDTPDYGIYMDYLISEKELDALRQKVKKEPYKTEYEKARKIAYDAMETIPEERISRTSAKHHRARHSFAGILELAIVGQIEQNKDMLKMACRYALSLASCEYWCADVMETVPMVTWCHRAFEESYMIQYICTVIWLAGGLFSWHGLNYLYNRIIMKGFPRIEADLMTVDYIYHCNQGIAFLHGYIQGLITLVGTYPRYKTRLDEARDLHTKIFDNVFGDDGSFEEGGAYWNYTLWHFIPAAHYISRYEGKPFGEIFGKRMQKISNFGISILAENGSPIPFGDCNDKMRYSMMIPALMYSSTGDARWAALFPKTNCRWVRDMVIASTVDIPQNKESISGEFCRFDSAGIVKVLRNNILFAGISGPSNDTHCHGDKGSFVIYKGDELLVPEVYVSYDVSDKVIMNKSINHSLAVPVIDGEYIEQLKGKEYRSVIEKASFENGIFEWRCNNGGIWASSDIKTNIRTVYSDKANEFIITDEFEFSTEAEVEFKLNIKNEDDVIVTAVDWIPSTSRTIVLQDNEDRTVYQKQLRTAKTKKCCLKTKIVIAEG